jgi:hypothetical protein
MANETIEQKVQRVHRRIYDLSADALEQATRVGKARAQFAAAPDDLKDVYRGQLLACVADVELWMTRNLRDVPVPAHTAQDKLDDLDQARPWRRPRC